MNGQRNIKITYAVRTLSFKKIYKPYKGPIYFLPSTKKPHFFPAVTDYIASRYAIWQSLLYKPPSPLASTSCQHTAHNFPCSRYYNMWN
jgi:hypothetical protein